MSHKSSGFTFTFLLAASTLPLGGRQPLGSAAYLQGITGCQRLPISTEEWTFSVDKKRFPEAPMSSEPALVRSSEAVSTVRGSL